MTDSFDPDRQVLARARSTEVLAPHTLENPLTFYTSGSNFTTSLEKVAEVGFEMIVFSFGQAQLESLDKVYLAKVAAQVALAQSKGIEVGGYDLICADRSTYIDPATGKSAPLPASMSALPRGSACMASAWYEYITHNIFTFVNATGLRMLDTDGPYGGAKCASKNHSHHHDENDSVYWQTRYQSEFYHELRRQGLYLHVPDNYFFSGSQVTGMGYNEQQFSLPRWRDLTVSRMSLYDDLYDLRPTQGWMLIPLSDYHAGGDGAAFAGHAKAYEWGLAQYLGAGLGQSQVGGREIYSTPETREVVMKWTAWFKRHREILIQPIVHLRRPTAQGWDGWLHPHPRAALMTTKRPVEVAVASIFNPSPLELDEIVAIPLYYTGLADKVLVTINDWNGTTTAKQMSLERDYYLLLQLKMPAGSITTLVFEQP
jgi:hypothetical protein